MNCRARILNSNPCSAIYKLCDFGCYLTCDSVFLYENMNDNGASLFVILGKLNEKAQLNT